MKTKTKYTIISIICFVIIAIVGGIVYFNITFCHGLTDPRILKIKSPSNEFVAVLVTTGFVDRGTELYMSKSGNDNKDLKLVGNLCIEGMCYLDDAAWSKDGSLFIVRSEGGEPFYSHCYDTKNNMSIIPSRKQKKEQKDYWTQYSQKLTKLIKDRGTPTVFIGEIENKSRKMGYWEWQNFRKILKKANK